MERKDGNVGHNPNAGPNNQAGMKPGGGYPGPASPPQGYAPQGHPPQGYAPQGYSPQNYNPGNYPAPGMPAPYGYPQPPPGAFQAPPGQPNYGQYGVPPVHYQQAGPGAPTGWMPAPPPNPNCPPGLEYLSQIDQLLVHQQVELLEALIGFESNNKYEIKNSMGQRVYFAAEQNDCCTRNCFGSARYFVITIVDNLGREVIRLSRPCRCSACCFPCCLQKLQVESPPGTIVGYVKQNWHPCLPKFTILNEMEEEVMKITGPCIPCRCCSDVNFELKSLDESSVLGRISKQWSGILKEMFTDADNFGVQFPMDLDVKMKAVILGACFLIDFMYFEHSEDK